MHFEIYFWNTSWVIMLTVDLNDLKKISEDLNTFRIIKCFHQTCDFYLIPLKSFYSPTKR